MRESRAEYAVCRAGAKGWFWAGWAQGFTYGCDPDTAAPTHEGYAVTEEAAMHHACVALGIAPLSGAFHGPGSETRRRAHGCLQARWARDVLRGRAIARRMERPSRKTDPQQQHTVYQRSYSSREYAEDRACSVYVPHHVMRESARFFWVNTEDVSREASTHDHPESLRTVRLDRQKLEAGAEVRSGQGWGAEYWVLSCPATAVKEGTYWADYTRTGAAATPPCLAALGLVLPCTVTDVTQAYRVLAREAHPDTGGSHEAFLALQEHYNGSEYEWNRKLG